MTRLSNLSAGLVRLPVILGIFVLWEITAALWGDPMFVARPSQVIATIPGLIADSRTLTPSFCLNQPTEPSLLRYSVLLLGDGKPQPVITGRPVAGPGEALPPC